MGYRPYQILTLLYLWNRYPLQLLPIELKGPDGPLRQALFKSMENRYAAGLRCAGSSSGFPRAWDLEGARRVPPARAPRADAATGGKHPYATLRAAGKRSVEYVQ